MYTEVHRCLNLFDICLIVFQEDPEDFAEEQGMMGRFINLLQADNADQQYLVSWFSLGSSVCFEVWGGGKDQEDLINFVKLPPIPYNIYIDYH